MKNYSLIKSEKIWSGTRSNPVHLHAFLSGSDAPAACRKNIRSRSNVLISAEDQPRTLLLAHYCQKCIGHVTDMVNRREASVQPSTDSKPVSSVVIITDAPACICPVRTDYHNETCLAFQQAHNVADTDNEENDMAITHRRKDGPLSPRQTDILDRLIEGCRQNEIARAMNPPVSPGYLSDELRVAAAKMSAKTPSEALAVYATAKAYRECAGIIRGNRVPWPNGEVDEHVNHVLMGIAEYLEAAAARMLPS